MGDAQRRRLSTYDNDHQPWCAPEMFTVLTTSHTLSFVERTQQACKRDVYSVGIMLLLILVGQDQEVPLYQGTISRHRLLVLLYTSLRQCETPGGTPETIASTVSSSGNVSEPKIQARELILLLEAMVHANVDRRPTASQALARLCEVFLMPDVSDNTKSARASVTSRPTMEPTQLKSQPCSKPPNHHHHQHQQSAVAPLAQRGAAVVDQSSRSSISSSSSSSSSHTMTTSHSSRTLSLSGIAVLSSSRSSLVSLPAISDRDPRASRTASSSASELVVADEKKRGSDSVVAVSHPSLSSSASTSSSSTLPRPRLPSVAEKAAAPTGTRVEESPPASLRQSQSRPCFPTGSVYNADVRWLCEIAVQAKFQTRTLLLAVYQLHALPETVRSLAEKRHLHQTLAGACFAIACKLNEHTDDCTEAAKALRRHHISMGYVWSYEHLIVNALQFRLRSRVVEQQRTVNDRLRCLEDATSAIEELANFL